MRDAFVAPFYLRFLHGNFTRANEVEGAAFRQAVATAASEISDDQITCLLTEREWRGRLCAGWFVGLSGRFEFIPRISELLLASEMVYAGQGYCLALAVIGNEECANCLRAYLDKYLPLNDKIYNQDWAIGALAQVRGEAPLEYLQEAMWREGQNFVDPAQAITDFGELVSYLRHHRMLNAMA